MASGWGPGAPPTPQILLEQARTETSQSKDDGTSEYLGRKETLPRIQQASEVVDGVGHAVVVCVLAVRLNQGAQSE